MVVLGSLRLLSRKHPHPLRGDLYTPVTPELRALFDRMRAEHGTYRNVCAVSGTRMKVFRNLRTGRRKAVSLRLLDRIITTTGVGSVGEFTWFTAEDLVKLGIWKPVQYVEGRRRFRLENDVENNTLQEDAD